jgi:hypothetical protein
MRALLFAAALALSATVAADNPAIAPHVRLAAAVISGDIDLLPNADPDPAGAWDVFVLEVNAQWGEITGDISSVSPGSRPRLLVLTTDRGAAP